MKQLAAFGFLVLTLAATGCGDSSFGRVQGTVTLDDQPLPKARIEFIPLPDVPNGSPSYGETDERGHYEMSFGLDQPGVMVGKHQVVISTYEIVTNDDGSKTTIPEQVPAKYNEQTELQREVYPGSQTIDFALQSN